MNASVVDGGLIGEGSPGLLLSQADARRMHDEGEARDRSLHNGRVMLTEKSTGAVSVPVS